MDPDSTENPLDALMRVREVDGVWVFEVDLRALKAWDDAGHQGLRGDNRYEHVLRTLGRPLHSDFCAVKRLLRVGRSLK